MEQLNDEQLAQSADHVCPEEVIINVVNTVVSEYGPVHGSVDQALGNMAVYRRCLTAVREAYPCAGPATNANGHQVCPLADMAKNSKALATMPYPTASYSLQLGKVGEQLREAGGQASLPASGIPAQPGPHRAGQYL